jgi:hypothetical protein
MTMNCKDCKYYQHDGHYGSCKRFPKVEVKSSSDWCGEFAKLSTIPLPVYSVEDLKGSLPAITSEEVGEMMKPKRGRPAKEKL